MTFRFELNILNLRSLPFSFAESCNFLLGSDSKMRVLGESLCFCNGGGKSERMKAAIFSSKGLAMAKINSGGTGFLIHRNLLLTTHGNIPSLAAAEAADSRLQNGFAAVLFPHRFFITSSILDLTMVGLDVSDGESNATANQPHHLKTCNKLNLELGNIVYLLGYAEKQELTVGEGKVVIATDNLIKFSTDEVTWSPGSAGFDVHGNLAFMVCDPMKLATSPKNKYSSTSSSSMSSWKKGTPMQFGIPIPIICDWLNQHWEGNLDELSKPKLPLIKLMPIGQRSEHSCASFTMRQVFKSTEGGNEGTPTSKKLSRPTGQSGSSSTAVNKLEDDALTVAPLGAIHVQGVSTLEICESATVASVEINTTGLNTTQIQLLDINFPPRITEAPLSPQPSGEVLTNCGGIPSNNFLSKKPLEGGHLNDERPSSSEEDAESTGSVNGELGGVHSSFSPVQKSESRKDYSSEGETTMYSAETAESRNYSSPRKLIFYQIGRSSSCVSYNRWGMQKNPAACGAEMEKHRKVSQAMKVYSQGATSQRSNDYFSPTVSSIMKKRNTLEHQNRPRQSVTHSSSARRWLFWIAIVVMACSCTVF